MLDSGVDRSTISLKIVKSLGLKLEEYTGRELVTIGERCVRPVGQIYLTWGAEGKDRKFSTTFLVLRRRECRGAQMLIGYEEIEEAGFYIRNPVASNRITNSKLDVFPN